MNINYQVVPKIISSKDLDYLSDMFNWNYGVYKNTINAIDSVNDEEIKDVLNKASDLFYSNMNTIINLLNEEVNNG